VVHLLTSAPPPPPTPPLLRLDYSTQAAPRRPPLSRSPLRQSASLTRRTSWFGPASSSSSSSSFSSSSSLPSHCARCRCCCCLVSTYAEERRRHSPPSPVCEGRFQFAFTCLLACTIGFRAVPVNSPPFLPAPSWAATARKHLAAAERSTPRPCARSPRQPVMEISPKSI